MAIDSFHGEYRWLSNFWPCLITLNGKEYASTEHAYQAFKFLDPEMHEEVRLAKTAAKAKALGKREGVRADWNRVKLEVMRKCLVEKFKHPELQKKLLDTGNEELIEGNTWNDRFWGVCDGVGENHLGKLLMEIRDEIRSLYDLGVLP